MQQPIPTDYATFAEYETAWKEYNRAKDEQARKELQPAFDEVIKALGMVRIGEGNNDLHQNASYTLFIAMFPSPHLLLCNHGNTTSLYGCTFETAGLIQWAKKNAERYGRGRL
jgi:hypothetical protein